MVEKATHQGAEPAAAPEAPPRKPPPPLNERNFQPREFTQIEYAALVPKGTTVEDLQERGFWAHNAAKLRPMAKIVVMTEDRLLYCELIVFATGSNWAEVRVLKGSVIKVDHVTARGSAGDDFEIVDGGMVKQWTVVDKRNGREIKADGTLKTQEAARLWLGDFLKSQGLNRAA